MHLPVERCKTAADRAVFLHSGYHLTPTFIIWRLEKKLFENSDIWKKCSSGQQASRIGTMQYDQPLHAMPAVNPNKDKAFEIEVDEEKEVDQLEAELNELAENVIELRRTMKLVFRDKMESLLLAMRPKLPKDELSSSEESKVTQGTRTPLVSAREEQLVDHETAAQIALLKSKIAANVAAMPATTERMKLCIEKIDRLDQYKVNIDYVFTKKMDSDN